uniref:Putative secreted protein n=1 Tax=Anopheles darlingi TaxID=43151 RepID=A0A2M4DG96_ANODA
MSSPAVAVVVVAAEGRALIVADSLICIQHCPGIRDRLQVCPSRPVPVSMLVRDRMYRDCPRQALGARWL